MSQVTTLPLAATPRKPQTLFDASLVWPAILDAFKKLDPRTQVRSPVMFVVYVGSILTTFLYIHSLARRSLARPPASSSPSAPGSGSRCCSQTSPKRWPKDAARRRRHRCVA